MPKICWTCPICRHEAFDYDEVEHECADGVDYEANGDELQSAIDRYEPDPMRLAKGED